MNKKQSISTDEQKAADKALMKEVASKLKNRTLFPEKVARAKAYLKISVFPPEFNSKKA
jgi:hypothetical protein